MNLGQYVTDLISKSNQLQKIAANTQDPVRIYELAADIKSISRELQNHVVKEFGKNA